MVSIQTAQLPPETPYSRKWTRQEYYQLAELGFFNGQRVMLIEGDIVLMPPQKNDHAWAITILAEKLREIFGREYVVREEKPLHVAEDSEPEPDLAVIPGSIEHWRGKPHPTGAVLVVEVSDSSLSFDQNDKASLYASIGIPDYWVLNLKLRCIEVNRTPVPDPKARFAYRYGFTQAYGGGESLAPLEKPGSVITVADILP